jgi:hypothetical protein
MKKYYLGVIFERNGEYEYYTHVKFKLKDGDSPDDKLNTIAKDWYSSTPDEEDEGYYFNCGDVFVQPYKVDEISAQTFNEIDSVMEM